MSGHGHVTPNPGGVKARCGGPALCGVCAKEQAAQRAGSCARCGGTEWVCGAHPGKPWTQFSSQSSMPGHPGPCGCAPGVPCPDCHPAGARLGDGEGPHAAREPATMPDPPLTAAAAACFIEKEIG